MYVLPVTFCDAQVDRSDAGRYVCVVKTVYGHVVAEDLFLQVQCKQAASSDMIVYPDQIGNSNKHKHACFLWKSYQVWQFQYHFCTFCTDS